MRAFWPMRQIVEDVMLIWNWNISIEMKMALCGDAVDKIVDDTDQSEKAPSLPPHTCPYRFKFDW
jgi:hypothetical protein